MSSTDGNGPRGSHTARAAVLTLAACSLLLAWGAAHTAYVASPQGSIDAGLFVRLANNIHRGEWLGPYDNLTLAKGPFYSMFLAATGSLGLRFLLAQALVYLAGIWLLALTLRRILGTTPFAMLACVPLAANPALFAAIMLRPTREGIYLPLTMLLCGLSWQQAVPDRGWRLRVPRAVLTGLLLAAFWITREEGLWLLPALAAAWLYGLIACVQRAQWRGAAHQAAVIAMTVAIATAGVTVIGQINQRYYGTSDIVEFKQTEFLRGYDSLARIEALPAQPFVEIPHATLVKAAAASPLAARLLPVFNSDEAKFFALVGCQAQNISPCDGEIRNGWFMWVLRDAVAATGAYRSAADAKAYYTGLAQQIDAACADNRLTCRAQRLTMAPPFTWRSMPETLLTAWHMVVFMATMDGIDQPAGPITCNVPDPRPFCARYADFLHLLHTPLFVIPAATQPPETRADYAAWQAETAQLPAARKAEWVGRTTGALRTLFAALLPLCLAAAAAAFTVATIFVCRRRHTEPAYALATFCLLVVSSRVGLLAYVDTVAIPSINAQYLSPAYPFLFLFCALAPLALWRVWLTGGK